MYSCKSIEPLPSASNRSNRTFSSSLVSVEPPVTCWFSTNSSKVMEPVPALSILLNSRRSFCMTGAGARAERTRPRFRGVSSPSENSMLVVVATLGCSAKRAPGNKGRVAGWRPMEKPSALVSILESTATMRDCFVSLRWEVRELASRTVLGVSRRVEVVADAPSWCVHADRNHVGISRDSSVRIQRDAIIKRLLCSPPAESRQMSPFGT